MSHTELQQPKPDRKHLALQPFLIHYKESVIFTSSQLVLDRYNYFTVFFFTKVKKNICHPPPPPTTFNTLSLSRLFLILSLVPWPPTCYVPASNRGRDSPALLVHLVDQLIHQMPSPQLQWWLSSLSEIKPTGKSPDRLLTHQIAPLSLFQHFPYLLVLHPPCCFALATNWSRDYPLYWRSSRLRKL